MTTLEMVIYAIFVTGIVGGITYIISELRKH